MLKRVQHDIFLVLGVRDKFSDLYPVVIDFVVPPVLVFCRVILVEKFVMASNEILNKL